VGFLSVVSDQLLPIIAGQSFLADRSTLIICMAGVIGLPLCMLRNINAFVLTSYLAVGSIIYMSVIVVYYAMSLGPEYYYTGTVHLVNPDLAQVFKAIPIICYAFNCHLAYVAIFNELKPRGADGEPYQTVKNMDKVAMGAYGICLTLYVICGVCGYLLFGENLSDGGDILAQLPGGYGGSAVACGKNVTDSTCVVVDCPPGHSACPYDVHVARMSVAVAVLSLYPKLQWVARTCIDDLLVNHGYAKEVLVSGEAARLLALTARTVH
jgi:hypothetical protein